MHLLEREAELGLLKQMVGETVGGRGALALIGGEAGIGKTSLVAAMREQLPGAVAFVSAGCEPLSVPVPLAPLRELLHACDGEDLLAAVGDDRVASAQTMLTALRERSPIVAVVEDAHWADPLTLDVLRLVLRRIDDAGVLIVLTYRDDEVGANPSLGLFLGDLASRSNALRLALAPLSDAAVNELAGGIGLDAGRLRDATGGNPFLVVESIAAGGRLPASVRDAALARAGRLSLRARELVDAAAVLGRRFDAWLLEAIAGDRFDAIDEVLARGVLLSEGSALGFRHELIREALELGISPAQRLRLHARAWAVLAAPPHRADDALLAHHAELGGLADEAAAHARLAAGAAERVGAVRETYLQAKRALRLGSRLDVETRFELLVQLARAANFVSSNLEEGVEAAQCAVELAEGMGDERRRGQALMVLSYAWWSLERVVEARSAAEQAIAAFEPADDGAALAWAEATLIRIQATSFEPREALRAIPAAQQLAARAGVQEVEVDLAISRGLVLGHLGDATAVDTLEEALRAARRGGFTIRMVRGCVNLITVAVAMRDHARVDQVAAEASATLEDEGVSRLPQLAIRLAQAQSRLDRGRWDDALALAAQREPWWQGQHPVACAMEGLIRARRGEPGADALVERAWADLNEMVAAESARHAMLRLARIESAWLRGDSRAAVARLSQARDAGAVLWFNRWGSELAVWGARLGVPVQLATDPPPPIALELEGDWRGAIAAWLELQAPYEAALAALPGDERAAREAMTTLQRLGARGAARAFASGRVARGARSVRGGRSSTLAHPAGLTRREQEVLEVLESGASNAEIASSLHLSERTVGHHISAILMKLGVSSRHEAVEHARRAALLSKPPER